MSRSDTPPKPDGDEDGFTREERAIFERIAEDADDERVQRIGEILLQSSTDAKVVDSS